MNRPKVMAFIATILIVLGAVGASHVLSSAHPTTRMNYTLEDDENEAGLIARSIEKIRRIVSQSTLRALKMSFLKKPSTENKSQMIAKGQVQPLPNSKILNDKKSPVKKPMAIAESWAQRASGLTVNYIPSATRTQNNLRENQRVQGNTSYGALAPTPSSPQAAQQAKNQNQNLSAEEWARLFANNQNTRELMAFTARVQKGEISSQIFFATMQILSMDTRYQVRQMALFGYNAVPSLTSFVQLNSLLKTFENDPELLTQTQSVLENYSKNLNNVSILGSVLEAHLSPEVQLEALTLVQRAAQNFFIDPQTGQPIQNAEQLIQAAQVFTRISQSIKTLAQISSDQAVLGMSQQTLSLLQGIIPSVVAQNP